MFTPDFVKLSEFDPRLLITSCYAMDINFVGRPIAGYGPPSSAMLSRAAAAGLKRAQDKFAEDGYRIVIYDAYRPEKAVNEFIAWSLDVNDNKMRDWFYPAIDKSTLFERGFLAKKSTHSRGCAVDMSIIKDNRLPANFTPSKRVLNDGTEFTFLRDGSVDMGTHFDYFGEASYTASSNIPMKASDNRMYLKKIMEFCGFENFHKEWWHFTFINEPYPDQYFDFDII